MKDEDYEVYLEIARYGMSMVGDEIAEQMDMSDDEFLRLRDQLEDYMNS
tara:strand:- start:1353 stop:1499 length:147 start_codon:yes stop_codon:yes gene_type:complete